MTRSPTRGVRTPSNALQIRITIPRHEFHILAREATYNDLPLATYLRHLITIGQQALNTIPPPARLNRQPQDPLP